MKSSYSQVLQQMEQLNDKLNEVSHWVIAGCRIPDVLLGATDDITTAVRAEGQSG